jgi:hypothetical protein
VSASRSFAAIRRFTSSDHWHATCFQRPCAAKTTTPHTYNDGRLYRLARGHDAKLRSDEDVFAATHVVADLRKEGTTHAQMLRLVEREMRIRFYKLRSVKAYASALRQFPTWLGAAPAEANCELLRKYLEILVDGGASASGGPRISLRSEQHSTRCAARI